MPITQPLDHVPLWALPLITLAIMLLAVELGFRLGRHRSQRTQHEKESLVGAAVAATLALVGLMLAFTFGIAGARFEARRQAVLDEANAVGTTYLRASLLPDDRGKTIRSLLRQYVDVRLEAVQTGRMEEGLRRSAELHNRLWAEAEPIARAHPESIQVGLFIQSLNEMIDLHTTRVMAGIHNRIPQIVWFSLHAINALAMLGIGYHAGLSGNSRSMSFILLAVALTVVMYLVTDLDRPREGMLRVSQQAIVDLRSSMDAPSSK
jgi:hypothetical protein